MISHNKRKENNWIDHILGRYCLLKHVIEGKTEGRKEVTGRRARRGKQLPDEVKKEMILETERGSTRSHSVENSLWKRLWTCCTPYYGINE
jgi:hypothetical protein